MKRIFLPTLLFFILISCIGETSCGQVKKTAKDSIPQEKKYVFVIEPQGQHIIDSILVQAYLSAGYELPTRNGDALKNGLGMVINYFRQAVHYQDSVYNAQFIKPKK